MENPQNLLARDLRTTSYLEKTLQNRGVLRFEGRSIHISSGRV